MTQSQSAPGLWKPALDGFLFCIYMCWEARDLAALAFLFGSPPPPLLFHAEEESLTK